MARCLLFMLLVCAAPSLAAQDTDPFAKWEKEIAAFEVADAKSPPPPNPILFVGSSSIRLWPLEKSFPNHQLLNRGFGGSQIVDSNHFAPRIVTKYKPRQVIFYAGDNDVATGKKALQVRDDFVQLVATVRKELPDAPILFIAIKPSLKRWALFEVQKDANRLVAEFCKATKGLTYLDVVTPMLGADGKPREEYFVEDGLHLNEKGYAAWTVLLKPHLLAKP